MLIPIRCYSCNKLLADKWRAFQEDVGEEEGEGRAGKAVESFRRLGIVRYCCKRMLLGQVDLVGFI